MCSVQAPPSPLVLVGGLAGCSFGDSTAVLVCLAEVALAQLVFVQYTVGLLHDGTWSQLFTSHDPCVLCVGYSVRRARPNDCKGIVVGFQNHLFGGVRDWQCCVLDVHFGFGSFDDQSDFTIQYAFHSGESVHDFVGDEVSAVNGLCVVCFHATSSDFKDVHVVFGFIPCSQVSVHVEVWLGIEFRTSTDGGHLAGHHGDRSCYQQQNQFRVEHHRRFRSATFVVKIKILCTVSLQSICCVRPVWRTRRL
ncbi:unnamed protein product [Aphis gossypii]|uniref:Uncharacterized protein n=1 Tax=Aphis gossypii TaxID=80765 RepID=A0A9P0NN50_APHGO|nr:unnamed protein product [Aphis gossypii]